MSDPYRTPAGAPERPYVSLRWALRVSSALADAPGTWLRCELFDRRAGVDGAGAYAASAAELPLAEGESLIAAALDRLRQRFRVVGFEIDCGPHSYELRVCVADGDLAALQAVAGSDV